LFYPKKSSTFAIFNVGALRATPADFGDTRPPISGIPVHFFVV